MKDLTPQERIDLMDLVRYAYTNKYIKRYTVLRMDDPIRKVTQRILSKMFPDCGIVKSRSSDSYNISFEPNQLYHGDRSYYRHDNNNVFSINLITNQKSNLEPFFSGKAELDNQIFKMLMVIANKEYPGLKDLYTYTSEMYTSEIQEQILKEIKDKYEDFQEAAHRQFTDKEIEQTKKDLTEIHTMIAAFQTLMSNRAEENFIGIDPALRQLVNINNIFVPQKYGFSLHYRNFQESYHRYRRNYGYNNNDRIPLVRRFTADGPIFRTLENYKKANDLYNILKKQMIKYAGVITILSQLSYVLEGTNRRRNPSLGRKFALALEFVDTIVQGRVELDQFRDPEVGLVVRHYSDIYNTNILSWLKINEFDPERNKRLKKLMKYAEDWSKAVHKRMDKEMSQIPSLPPIMASTTSSANSVISWSTIATTDSSDTTGE